VEAAVAAGLEHLGENRVQEAAGKIERLRGLQDRTTWHLIGHLQSNKARKAAGLFSWIHSVDRTELLERLERHATELDRRLEVLIQVDLGGEPTKHGTAEKELAPLLEAAGASRALKVRGLMTIPPLLPDPEQVRPYFRKLRELRDALARPGLPLAHLSMGMTNDFEVAIEEGATMVRVGRAIFGERVR